MQCTKYEVGNNHMREEIKKYLHNTLLYKKYIRLYTGWSIIFNHFKERSLPITKHVW